MKSIKIILVALISGFINGMFSTGAGLILVPSMIYILKDDEYVARGNTIITVLALTIINIFIYTSKELFSIDIIYIVIGGIIGSVIGNKLLYKISKNTLSLVFAIFTIIMGIGLIK